MFTLLFIAMLLSMIIAWAFIRKLQEKPWTEHGILVGSQDEDGVTSSAPKVGLWLFLGVVASLFLIFIGAYFMRIDTTHGGIAAGHMHAWVPIDEPGVLWVNTIVLILASLAIQLAHSLAGKTDVAAMRRYFNTAGFLTMLFLLGQGFAWQQLYATGNYGVASPAFSFLVMLTAIHGLHLIGGLVVWARTAGRLRAGLEEADLAVVAAIRQSVQLCATYWHFLLLIWIVLFAVLLTT
jgi:cytochrome c oxidase subunit 3